MDQLPAVMGILFLATLGQSMVGFGFALISMPLLGWVIGIELAAPLVALTGIAVEVPVLIAYRRSFDLSSIRGLIIGAVLGIPVGMVALRVIPEDIILSSLGLVLVFYAIYGLVGPRLAPPHNPRWIYGFGFLAGCLGGAYNTSGPPIIVYGDMIGWSRSAFKSNLQGLFLVMSLLITSAHFLSGNINDRVFSYGLWALPGVVLAIWLGIWSDHIIPQAQFKRLVLVGLLGLGLGLLRPVVGWLGLL